jgi:hypothetical protein
MSLMIFTAIVAIATAATFTALVRGGHTQRIDLIGWAGASLGTLSVVILVFCMIATGEINADVLVFVGVIAALVAFAAAVVQSIRNRQPAFDDRTQQQQPAGTYASQTVQMRRRRI